jgi:hypothetical protein
MRVYVADVHEHVQRLVSVVKLANVLEENPMEEQHSVVYKRINARVFINKHFLFTVGNT